MNGYIKKGPLIFLVVCAILFSGYVIVEYGFFAFTEPPAAMAEKAEVQRGSILDRNGKALAVPTAFYHFGVSPSSIKNKELFAQLVAPVISESEAAVFETLEKSQNSSFIYLKKKIDSNTYEELRKVCNQNGFSGVVKFDKLPGRVYPENELASQLIGFVGHPLPSPGRSGKCNSGKKHLPHHRRQSSVKSGKNCP